MLLALESPREKALLRAAGERPFASSSLDSLRTTGDSRTLDQLYSQHHLGGTATFPSTELLSTKPPQDLSKEEMLTVGRFAPSNAQGVPALERFLDIHFDDPAANSARLRLARRLLGRKDYARVRQLAEFVEVTGTPEEKAIAALVDAYATLSDPKAPDGRPKFQAIANDESAPPAIRMEAMRAFAYSSHARRDYPAAWFAFRQMADNASDPDVVTDARVQLAGIAFELVTAGKSTWEETRALCDAALASETGKRQSHATAALMKLETYFFEEDFQTCSALIDAFLNEYGDIPRETSMAKIWKGLCHIRMDQLDAAETVLSGVAALELAPDQMFRNKDPRAIALSWLVWIADKKGDAEVVNARATTLEESYPGSGYARTARAIANHAAYQAGQGGSTAPHQMPTP